MKTYSFLLALIAACAAGPLTKFGGIPSSQNNFQMAYQTLGVSRVEQPEQREIHYQVRPASDYEQYEHDEDITRRVQQPVTTTHIQTLVGNDDTQLVRSAGNFGHLQKLLRQQTDDHRQEVLPVGRRGPIYALVQSEVLGDEREDQLRHQQDEQLLRRQQEEQLLRRQQADHEARRQQQEDHEARRQQHEALLRQEEEDHQQRRRQHEQLVRRQEQEEQLRRQQAQVVTNANFQRQQQADIRQHSQQHLQSLTNTLTTRPVSVATEDIDDSEYVNYLIRTGQVHRFESQDGRAQEQEKEQREEHERSLQRQLMLQQQLHEHHLQQTLHLEELERRENARRPNRIQTLTENRNVQGLIRTGPVSQLSNVDVQELQQDRAASKFALVDYARSEHRERDEQVFPEEQQARPIRLRQQVSSSNSAPARRVASVEALLHAGPEVTPEVAQAAYDHFQFYNAVAKNLPVLSLEETDPEAAAILRQRQGH